MQVAVKPFARARPYAVPYMRKINGDEGKPEWAKRLDELLSVEPWVKFTEAEQARRFNMGKSLLNQWKAGRVPKPSYEKVRAVCSKLGANVEWLLDGRGEKYGTTTENNNRSNPATQYGSQQPVGIEKMRLKEQQDFMALLMEDMPRPARVNLLRQVLQQALQEKWIDSIPDAVLADWSATDKIAEAQKKSKAKAQG